MNVERLRNAIDAVTADYSDAGLIQLLAQVESAFAQSVQSPNPQTADAFASAKDALDEAVQQGECVKLSPSRLAILERINAQDLCGVGILERIEAILKSAVTPAAVVQGLQELRTRAQEFQKTATALRDSLKKLGVEGEHPPTDAAELEVRLPFELFDRSLGGFAKEAKLLDRALCDIVETVSGSRPPVRVKTLAGGSVEIFVTVDAMSGASVLVLVTAIMNLINSVMQNRKIRLDLEKDKAPKEVLEPFVKWEETRVADELAKLRDELLSGSGLDKPRKNELKKALTDSLRYLADRIDRGMDIEVATLLDQGPDGEEAQQGPDKGSPVARAQRQIAQSMNKRRRLPKRDQPVLALPPIEEEDDKVRESKPKS